MRDAIVRARGFAAAALVRNHAWVGGSNPRAGETTVSPNSELANLISAPELGGERTTLLSPSIIRPINISRGLACGESLNN
jgi:hypothetical protein